MKGMILWALFGLGLSVFAVLSGCIVPASALQLQTTMDTCPYGSRAAYDAYSDTYFCRPVPVYYDGYDNDYGYAPRYRYWNGYQQTPDYNRPPRYHRDHRGYAPPAPVYNRPPTVVVPSRPAPRPPGRVIIRDHRHR